MYLGAAVTVSLPPSRLHPRRRRTPKCAWWSSRALQKLSSRSSHFLAITVGCQGHPLPPPPSPSLQSRVGRSSTVSPPQCGTETCLNSAPALLGLRWLKALRSWDLGRESSPGWRYVGTEHLEQRLMLLLPLCRHKAGFMGS